MLSTPIKLNLHIIYWILAFFQGVIILLGFPTALFKVGMPLIVIILLMDRVIKRNKKFIILGLLTYLLLFFVSVISGLINNISFFSIIYFLRYVSLPYLYFLILVNEPDKRILKKVLKVIIFLFFIQIPAAFIKLLVMGISEEVIGTINTLSGSLSTTIPVFVSIFLLAYWLDKKSKIYYLVLIILFLGFGIVGGKRAIVYLLPIFLLFTYFFYMHFSKKNKKVKKEIKKKVRIFPILILTFLIFYLTARINPSLNPEGKVWGSFDLNYLISYTEKYATTGKTRVVGDIPRIEALGYFWLLQSNKTLKAVLLGDGAGKLIVSSFNENAGENPMVVYYNVFYGGRMGVIWIFLQIGLVGTFFYFFLFFKVLRNVTKGNLLPGEKAILYSVTLLFLFDSFYYSKTFIYYQVLIGVFFTYLAYLKKSNGVMWGS